MTLEKRLTVTLAKCLTMVLLTCTVEAQLIYRRLLPRVQPVQATLQEDGYVLPQTALYPTAQGDCVYRIEEREGRFGVEYRLKAIPVTVLSQSEGLALVTGLYNPDWLYAAGATAPLADGAEILPAD